MPDSNVGIIQVPTPYSIPFIVLYRGPHGEDLGELVFSLLASEWLSSRKHKKDGPYDYVLENYFPGDVWINVLTYKRSPSNKLPVEKARYFASHLRQITRGATNFKYIVGPLREIARPLCLPQRPPGLTDRELLDNILSRDRQILQGLPIPPQAVKWLEDALPKALSGGGLLITQFTDPNSGPHLTRITTGDVLSLSDVPDISSITLDYLYQ